MTIWKEKHEVFDRAKSKTKNRKDGLNQKEDKKINSIFISFSQLGHNGTLYNWEYDTGKFLGGRLGRGEDSVQ